MEKKNGLKSWKVEKSTRPMFLIFKILADVLYYGWLISSIFIIALFNSIFYSWLIYELIHNFGLIFIINSFSVVVILWILLISLLKQNKNFANAFIIFIIYFFIIFFFSIIFFKLYDLYNLFHLKKSALLYLINEKKIDLNDIFTRSKNVGFKIDPSYIYNAVVIDSKDQIIAKGFIKTFKSLPVPLRFIYEKKIILNELDRMDEFKILNSHQEIIDSNRVFHIIQDEKAIYLFFHEKQKDLYLFQQLDLTNCQKDMFVSDKFISFFNIENDLALELRKTKIWDFKFVFIYFEQFLMFHFCLYFLAFLLSHE